MLCNKGKWKKVSKKKKFKQEFGNEEEAFNDFFRIGLSLNWNKTNNLMLKLYEQFYHSDIIIASPLALRVLCGHQVDSKARDTSEKADQDFLSSIEYVVMDQSEAFCF
jgi:U3 small nucleolar RNA-associated protein 25